MYEQVFDPVSDSLGLSSIFAALPLITLFVLLAGFRVTAWDLGADRARGGLPGLDPRLRRARRAVARQGGRHLPPSTVLVRGDDARDVPHRVPAVDRGA